MRGRVSSLIFAAVFPSLAGAQVPEAADDFGTQDESITMVAAREFFPEDSSNVYHGDGRSRWSSVPLYAAINQIPNGALLTQVAFYFFDNSAVEDFTGEVCFTQIESDNPQSGGSAACFPGSAQSSGTPGVLVLATFPNERIQYRQGDLGTANVYTYNLKVSTSADGSVKLYMVRLRWHREVSPAPQLATFGDVSTNHQFFQFIEALSDSGITAGCQANPPLFCPDRTLTRGEMAVFLAKALGLHWPWDAQ